MLLISSCTEEEDQAGILTEIEISDLVFLRQEEKLAHDVYIYAYNKYADQIFKNIATSEQTHMDKIEALLKTYGISDPAVNLRDGEFTDTHLQSLYQQLTQKVDISLKDAYIVGATVEDLDIQDIEYFQSNTNQSDILDTYDALSCGSRNHLRSYTGRLEKLGYDYIPQFISADTFQAILDSDHESCGN